MKVSPVNKNNYYNVSHKAFFKPNTNFHILYGRQIKELSVNPYTVKELKELPNHCLEILSIATDKVFKLSNCGFKKVQVCTVLNHRTKQTLGITIEDKNPFNSLMDGIIKLKDKPFFNKELSPIDEDIYEALVTLNKFPKGLSNFLSSRKNNDK